MDVNMIVLVLGATGLLMLAGSLLLKGKRSGTKGRPDVNGPELEADIVAHLAVHGKIDAIKLYRKRTGAGIKEANDAVSDIASQRGIRPLLSSWPSK
jgi:hypothetical protein